MPYLRFTMTTYDDVNNCAYTAVVSPGYENTILDPVIEALGSFYCRMKPYWSKQIPSCNCISYEFADPVQKEHTGRQFGRHHLISQDDLHVALVDTMEINGWKWIGPNETYHDPINNRCITTWTFKSKFLVHLTSPFLDF
ncbi:unnamed protein product [Clavelina lepadiformis]|uniref:Uncharacterized protein n=1 Tax=Clavelina lepadiformis TaxID=159417 RepID=A0ABP0FY83_CLALP